MLHGLIAKVEHEDQVGISMDPLNDRREHRVRVVTVVAKDPERPRRAARR